MIIERNIVFLIVSLLLYGCAERAPEVTVRIRECAAMPGGGRASACVAVSDGKAYVFAGRDSAGLYKNDIWVYDPATDTWTYATKYPGKVRVNAAIAAYDGAIYAGLGFMKGHVYVDSCYLRDWWRFNPADGKWIKLQTYPNANTVAPVCYTLNDKIYITYGFGHGFTRDVCIYSPGTGRWTKLADKPRATANFGGRGALCKGRLFYGTGYNTSNLTDWFEGDLENDTWIQRKSIPGKGRQFAACSASAEYVYLFGGRYFGGDMTGGEVFDNILRYSPDTDQWELCGAMPCGRAENQIAFSVNGKVYFGLGEDEKGRTLNTLYCIE